MATPAKRAPVPARRRPRSPAPNRRSWPGPPPRSTSATSRSAGSRATPGCVTPPAGSVAFDGVTVGGGATALESKASPCPDRPSSSDALLAYGADSCRGRAGTTRSAATPASTAGQHDLQVGGAHDRPHRLGPGDRDRRRRLAGDLPLQRQRRHALSEPARGPGQPRHRRRPTVSTAARPSPTASCAAPSRPTASTSSPASTRRPDNDEFGCVSVEFTTP